MLTLEEAVEIYMAWQVGANYPEHLLPMAILILKNNEERKCSRCFSDLDEGSSVDCFYPYHVEECVCSGCMTDQERQNRDKWILHKKSQEQKP